MGLTRKSKGPDSIFSPEGKAALMSLKHYNSCSDRKLIDKFNGHIHYQIFCNTILPAGEMLTNSKLVSQIRCEISELLLEINKLEKVLITRWLLYMENLESITCDTTCYEINIRYLTDVKILRESVAWVYEQIRKTIKSNKSRMARTKYLKWSRRYICYSKLRKKTKKKRGALTRGLLRLLKKLLEEIGILEQKYPEIKLRRGYLRRSQNVKRVLEQ